MNWNCTANKENEVMRFILNVESLICAYLSKQICFNRNNESRILFTSTVVAVTNKSSLAIAFKILRLGSAYPPRVARYLYRCDGTNVT